MFKKRKKSPENDKSTEVSQEQNVASQLTDSIDINSASKTRKWVSSLPVADMGETTRRIFAALTKLNNQTIDPQSRVESTEVLLPYVQMALENLDRHFLSRSFPLPMRSQKVFDLKKSLLMELAGSYQLAALDMLTKNVDSKKYLLVAISRALQYMSMVVLNDYSIYAKNQKSLWHDIHHLYLLACENGIHTKRSPQKEGDSESLTIEDQYKLINLVSLAGPNTLRIGEVTRVRSFFMNNLNVIKLIADVERVKSKYAHVTLLNSDEPASLMPVSELLNSPTSRIFDLSKVIHVLDQFIYSSESTELGTHESWPTLTHSLAKRLVHALTTIRNRRFKRFDRDDKSSMIIKLQDVINIVRMTESDHLTVGSSEEDAENDNIYEALAAEDSISSPWADIDVEELVTNRDVDIHSWQIENSSSDGYGLKQIVSEATPARVGELVALKDPKDSQEVWQILVTRWVDAYKGVGLRIGLELLSNYGFSVTVNSITSRKITQKLPVEGIFLPMVEGARNEAKLIFPGFIFHVDDELKVTMEGSEQHIQITKTDDTIGNFAYCNFKTLEVAELAENSIEAFDDVWEFL